MKKTLTIILLSCLLFGSTNQTFVNYGSQPTNMAESYSNGGEGDVGPPHTNKNNE